MTQNNSPLNEKMILTARQAIENHLSEKKNPLPEIPEESQDSRGVFVTLWDHRNKLRGCIGHITPICKTLTQEIVECAVASATKDPRFPPLKLSELEKTQIEISLLHPPEPIDGPESLDTKKYGVIVSKGMQKGLLLPDIEGVDSVEQQVFIAAQKAGIDLLETQLKDVRLSRFEVEKIKENSGETTGEAK